MFLLNFFIRTLLKKLLTIICHNRQNDASGDLVMSQSQFFNTDN